MNGNNEQQPIVIIGKVLAGIIAVALFIVCIANCSESRSSSYKYSGYSSRKSYTASTPNPTSKHSSNGSGFTPRKSSSSSDDYGASNYDDPEWFYENHYDDFDGYEDAELYWEEHGDN